MDRSIENNTESQQGVLLALPRELREEIYACLIDEYISAPASPSFPGERISHSEHQHDARAAHMISVRYAKLPLQCAYSSLLRANNQIREEIFDAIRDRSMKGTRSAELDVMVKGYQVWPTWTHFPLFVRPARRAWKRQQPDSGPSQMLCAPAELNVNVNLRIFSTEGFRSNDSWPRQPGTVLRDLFALLSQFVEHGPDFGHENSKYGEMSHSLTSGLHEKIPFDSRDQAYGAEIYRISTLSINIAFHDIYTRATHPETVHTIFKAAKELALSGRLSPDFKAVHIRAKFSQDGEEVEWSNAWDSPRDPNPQIIDHWWNIGLIKPRGIA